MRTEVKKPGIENIIYKPQVDDIRDVISDSKIQDVILATLDYRPRSNMRIVLTPAEISGIVYVPEVRAIVYCIDCVDK